MARTVYNKLLGGYFNVTGPHDTPLGGPHPTRGHAQGFMEGAQAGLDRKAVMTNPYEVGHSKHQGWAEGFHSRQPKQF